jgi:hypothetical protein
LRAIASEQIMKATPAFEVKWVDTREHYPLALRFAHAASKRRPSQRMT